MTASTAFAQSAMPAAGKNLTIGLVMVGPYNDQGWSQANYDGTQYVKAKVPGVEMIYIDKANSGRQTGHHRIPARREPCRKGREAHHLQLGRHGR